MPNKFGLIDLPGWREMYAKGLNIIEPFLRECFDGKAYRLYFKDGTQIIAKLTGSNDSDNGLPSDDPDYEELYEFDFKVIRIEKKGTALNYREGQWIILDYRDFFYKFEHYEEFIKIDGITESKSSASKDLNQNLKLTIDLLPRGAWYKNLSKTLPQKDWDRLRQAAYERAGYKCVICGAGNGQLEAHEVWEFDTYVKTQKLTDIIALCKSCHMVKHLRHTKMIGGEEYAKKHFMQVNKCDEQVFIEHYHEAESRFDELSKIENWTVDTSEVNNLG